MGLGWSCSPGSGVRHRAGQAWGETFGGLWSRWGGQGQRGRHRWLSLGSLWHRANIWVGRREWVGGEGKTKGTPTDMTSGGQLEHSVTRASSGLTDA